MSPRLPMSFAASAVLSSCTSLVRLATAAIAAGAAITAYIFATRKSAEAEKYSKEVKDKLLMLIIRASSLNISGFKKHKLRFL